ncbi:MAG: hypothetical protein C0475_00275 [Planctomyces sp.]|nr:hypothetical protein [Planctomyces sp.]MBA4119364.1 hypothetical protein [Isosphaera sp.]
METNWPVMISVAVLFPAFGAVVFVWWRRQYGVRARPGRLEQSDRRVVVLPGPERTPSAGNDDGHSRRAAATADPRAKDHA